MWTLDAAAAVAASGGDLGEATEPLGKLLQHRLAQRLDTAAEPRFWMLETIREFGLEGLGQTDEAESVRGRHAEHYLALAERQNPIRSPGLSQTN